MTALLPLLALPAFFVIGVGIYRPYKYGTTARRHVGLIPLALVVFGFIVTPLVLGLEHGGSQRSPSTLEAALVALPVVLATLVGAVNAWVFRPRGAPGRK
jgi:hypothetical protein